MKKFLTALLMGAFLFTSMAATIGCGGTEDKKADKKAEKKEEKKEEKK